MINAKQRENIVNWLVEDDQYNFSQGYLDQLVSILENGCEGYKNYSEIDLINEYYSRAEHDPLNIGV